MVRPYVNPQQLYYDRVNAQLHNANKKGQMQQKRGQHTQASKATHPEMTEFGLQACNY
jgi:hypothetical protein